MIEHLSQPWPWWVAGPLVGLVVPALLLFGGKLFGVSSSLRHVCAAALPGKKIEYFRYDWRSKGAWNLAFVAGLALGGFLAGTVLVNPDPAVAIAAATHADLAAAGVSDFTGMAPAEVFSWAGLATVPGFVCLVLGGFCLGFGARWAGGCTSGHAISGLAAFQLPSLVAVIGFFAGGLLVTFLLIPRLF